MSDTPQPTPEEQAFLDAVSQPGGEELLQQAIKNAYGVDVEVKLKGNDEAPPETPPAAPPPPVPPAPPEGDKGDEIVLYRSEIERISQERADAAARNAIAAAGQLSHFGNKMNAALAGYVETPGFDVVYDELQKRLETVDPLVKVAATDDQIRKAFQEVAGELLLEGKLAGAPPGNHATSMAGQSARIPLPAHMTNSKVAEIESWRAEYLRQGLTNEEVDEIVRKASA